MESALPSKNGDQIMTGLILLLKQVKKIFTDSSSFVFTYLNLTINCCERLDWSHLLEAMISSSRILENLRT